MINSFKVTLTTKDCVGRNYISNNNCPLAMAAYRKTGLKFIVGFSKAHVQFSSGLPNIFTIEPPFGAADFRDLKDGVVGEMEFFFNHA